MPKAKGKKSKVLVKKDVEKKLKALSEWKPNTKHTQIVKTFSFPNFVAALAFLAKITVHAEILDHHPDIELSYGKVKVKLSTHSEKGLTKKDFELAERIDKLRIN